MIQPQRLPARALLRAQFDPATTETTSMTTITTKLAAALGCAPDHMDAAHPDAISARSALAEYDARQVAPPPAPIDGNIVSRPEGEPNRYALLRYDERTGLRRWFGLIQWNGELLVGRQEQLMEQIVHALNAHRSHPIADKLAAIAQGDTYDEAALRQARELLASIGKRAMTGLAALATGELAKAADAAVLLAAVEPLYSSFGRTYRAPDGTLLNADGTRSIFDDVDH